MTGNIERLIGALKRFRPHTLVRPRRRGVRQDPPLPVLVEGGSSEGLADAIRERIRAILSITADISIVPPGSLPRSEYKSKLVDYSDARGE